MIVGFDDLAIYRGRVSLVDGCFDPLHSGHILYFKAALALGRPLLCNVASDRYVRLKHPPLLCGWQRGIVIDALRDITLTHLCEFDTDMVLEQLRPWSYVKGKDWEGRLPTRQVALCNRLGIRILFVETPLQESSTRLLESQAARSLTPRLALASENGHHDS